MYAHDLMLLSASVSGLQQLLDVCAHNAKDSCLQFNDKKSHCTVVGPKHKCKPSSLSLSGKHLQWVESVKYLGITFLSSKIFSVDLNQLRHKFFGCTNSILVHSFGVSELTKLHLMESYCYPVLSYALECFNLTSAILEQLSWPIVHFVIKAPNLAQMLTTVIQNFSDIEPPQILRLCPPYWISKWPPCRFLIWQYHRVQVTCRHDISG